jgi:NhaA family Na+:H+ antiporter
LDFWATPRLIEAADGGILLLAALITLVIANAPFGPSCIAFWQKDLGLVVGNTTVRMPRQLWINDGLMAVFFFVAGLEVKRESVTGELREFKHAVLSLAGAIGGMAVPAAIYLSQQWGTVGQHGLGIPMATDIAFVVRCMAILGSRIPNGLRIMLLSLSIADDIGAVPVIAIGYTEHIHLWSLGFSVLGIGLIILLRKIGVRNNLVYLLVGFGIWVGGHESGVHTTVAGVIGGLLTPTRSIVKRARLNFIIQTADIAMPVATATMLSLMLGKPIGIFCFSWLAVKARWAQLPEGVTWKLLLGGIGFTMAIFIAGLASEGDLLNHAKIGIMIGSLLSAVFGMMLIVLCGR